MSADTERNIHEIELKDVANRKINTCASTEWGSPEIQISGHVAFPVFDPAYWPGGGGGTVVKLLVVPDSEDIFRICGDTWVYDLYPEVYVGNDQEGPCRCPVCDGVENPYQGLRCFQIQEMFPYINLPESSRMYRWRHLSRPYLAAMTIGATEWIGSCVDTEEGWVCRYDDLTASGRALYAAMQAAYPGRRLVLLTTVDT